MADKAQLTITVFTHPFPLGVHVTFDRREHDVDGLTCWCGALRIKAVCDECEAGCWRCEDGFRDVSAHEAGLTDGPLIVMHRLG